MNPGSVRATARSVGELLGEDYYRVPVYQRNYAWGEEEIRQLIDDILDAARDPSVAEYFLGNIVVSSADGSMEHPFAVVDGQQRLTTLHLLAGWLERGGASLPRHPLSFESRPRAEAAFAHLGEAVDETIDPGIAQGFAIISQYARADELRGHLAFLRDRVMVVRLELPAATNLNRYFEVMNTRGEQLQQQDIVKARLMAALPDADRATFAWVWDACARMDTYVQMSLTSGNPGGVRERLFGEDWGWLRASSFAELVDAYARTDPQGAGLGGGGSLSTMIDRYATVRDVGDGDGEESEQFSSVIDFPVFLLHVLRILEGDARGEDETQLDDKKLVKRFQGWLDATDDAAARAREFAFVLLRCRHLFDMFVVKREFTLRTGDDGAWSLKRLVKGTAMSRGRVVVSPRYVGTFPLDRAPVGDESSDDAADSKRVRLLESALRVTYTSPRTMHWMTELLGFVLARPREGLNAEVVLATLRGTARRKIAEVFDPQGDLAVTGFDIPRIVFTYLDYLLAAKTAGGLDFMFTFRNSIEHFHPQHPDAEIRDIYGRLVDPQDRELLGNLALLTVRDNSKFTNLPPSEKAKARYIVASSPKLELMAKNAADWGTDSIRAHHREMVELLWADVRSSR